MLRGMSAGGRDRRHFDAIAHAMQVAHEERLREALGTHPAERMLKGLELGAGRLDDATTAALDRRALAQGELARRARALGLRR
jgi:hypothetical protein